MTGHYLDLGSASDWLNQISHTARRFSDVIWRGKQQQRPQMSAVFSGFLHMQKKVLLTIFYNIYITFCSLHHTRNLTLANSVCETAPKSLLRKYKIEIFKIAQPFPQLSFELLSFNLTILIILSIIINAILILKVNVNVIVVVVIIIIAIQGSYKTLKLFFKDFSRAFQRTRFDFQGPPTRNVISQIVQKGTFPVHSNMTLTLEMLAPSTSLHFSVYLS